MVTKCKMNKDDETASTNQTLYRSTGSLLYVTTSKPNIVQVVGMVARFQTTPKETHVKAVKRIFKYLKTTMEFDLWYPKCNNLNLTAYTNADWVKSVDDQKAHTSGGVFFLSDSLVSWLSKKKDSISLSTTKVEYIATISYCTQILWMKQNLKQIKVV